MEKVKLTKQQANIVKNLPSHTSCGRESLVESHFKQTFQNNWAFLNDLSTDDFIKCFYVPGSYEIEKTEQEQINELWEKAYGDKLNYYHVGIERTLRFFGREDLIPRGKS